MAWISCRALFGAAHQPGLAEAEYPALLLPVDRQVDDRKPTSGDRPRLATSEDRLDDIRCQVAELDAIG